MFRFHFLSSSDHERDALELMRRDHHRIEDLLVQLDQTTSRGEVMRGRLFTALKQQLVAHEFMEEQVIYPALRRHPKAKGLILESLQEHHVADLLVQELMRMPCRSEEWGVGSEMPRCGGGHHAPHP
jgi:hemerythrin superfamily protein